MKLSFSNPTFQQGVYYKFGTGFPIMLLHGFGEDHRIWEKQIAVLKNHFTLIIPEIPGTSDATLPSETMSMELIATYLHDILQLENIKQTILFGHSMGGYASLAFAEKYNESLLGLGLVHSSAFEDNEEKKQTRLKGIQIIEQGGKIQFVKALVPNLYSETSKQLFQLEIQNHLTRFLDISSTSLQAYYTAMMNRPDRSQILLNAPYPIFIFSGTEDLAVPIEQSYKQSYLANHTQFEVTEHIGHMGMIEASEKLSKCMINFCNDILTPKNT